MTYKEVLKKIATDYNGKIVRRGNRYVAVDKKGRKTHVSNDGGNFIGVNGNPDFTVTSTTGDMRNYGVWPQPKLGLKGGPEEKLHNQGKPAFTRGPAAGMKGNE